MLPQLHGCASMRKIIVENKSYDSSMHVVKLYFFLLFLFPKTSHSCGLCSTVLTRPCKLFSNAEFLSVHVYDYLSLLVLKPVGFLGATANPGKPSNPLRKRYFGWWNI